VRYAELIGFILCVPLPQSVTLLWWPHRGVGCSAADQEQGVPRLPLWRRCALAWCLWRDLAPYAADLFGMTVIVVIKNSNVTDIYINGGGLAPEPLPPRRAGQYHSILTLQAARSRFLQSAQFGSCLSNAVAHLSPQRHSLLLLSSCA